ncbi:MAG: hypothetical protein ABSC56_11730 [Solirubrobacteraceae bacterium]|jgi:hypothetical protein
MGRLRLVPWSVAFTGVLIGLVVGFLLAPSHRGGDDTYRGQDLWALVPSGWKQEPLLAPYGTALDGWFDLNNPADSLAVRATAPAGAAPQARAFARAHGLGKATRSWVYHVQWPGGRSAWEVLYKEASVFTALFEFDACSPAIAMTVTIDASSQSSLANEEDTLPQGAEPVCDGAAFSSPDRADVAVPLTLPSDP